MSKAFGCGYLSDWQWITQYVGLPLRQLLSRGKRAGLKSVSYCLPTFKIAVGKMPPEMLERHWRLL